MCLCSSHDGTISDGSGQSHTVAFKTWVGGMYVIEQASHARRLYDQLAPSVVNN